MHKGFYEVYSVRHLKLVAVMENFQSQHLFITRQSNLFYSWYMGQNNSSYFTCGTSAVLYKYMATQAEEQFSLFLLRTDKKQ